MIKLKNKSLTCTETEVVEAQIELPESWSFT